MSASLGAVRARGGGQSDIADNTIMQRINMANINVFGNSLGEVVPDIAVVSVTVGTLAYSFVEDAKREFGNSFGFSKVI